MKRSSIKFLTLIVAVAAFAGGYVFNLTMGQHGATAGTAVADTSTSATSNTLTTDPAVTSTTSAATVDAAIQGAYAVAGKSVVFVSNPGVGTGSGVVFDSQGDIVTNNHVISGGKSFKVTFINGKTVSATLVGADVADDLAVIHVNPSGLSLYPAHFAASSNIQLAEMVLAIGSPLGLQDTVTSGLVSGLDRTQQEPSGAYIPNSIQTSAPINPGNSGGALVDLEGRVIGIPTMVQTSTSGNETVQNVGFAIPSSRVQLIAPQLIATGKVEHTGRAFLGNLRRRRLRSAIKPGIHTPLLAAGNRPPPPARPSPAPRST